MATAPARPGENTTHVTVMPEPNLHIQHRRINRGLLAKLERRALRWLVERTPTWIEPDHLTALGVAGALLVMLGFVCANLSPYFVTLTVLGLFLNWYGDSLDGTLARYRKIERPLFGYFIDHSCDLISQSLIFVGFGLSPYFTMRSALIALSMYLLISSYTYLKVMTLRIHQLSYGGMGATELRAALGCWSLVAIFGHFDPTRRQLFNYPILDEITGVLSIAVFLAFVWMVFRDLSKMSQQLTKANETVVTSVGSASRRRLIRYTVHSTLE